MHRERQRGPERRVLVVDVRTLRVPRHQKDPISPLKEIFNIFKIHGCIIP